MLKKIMRHIKRIELDRRSESYLRKKQREIDDGKSVQQTWQNARKTKTMAGVFNVLCKMCGKRERCYYCEDYRGTDIEHFRPKDKYEGQVFAWKNMLLACAGCNRLKGTQFPVDEYGNPLLIDPTYDDSWNHLFFEHKTGILVARWDIEKDTFDPKGEKTTDPATLPLNIESLTEGRLRTFRRLTRAVKSYLSESSDPDKKTDALNIFLEAVSDNDDYGLTHWFFKWEGQKILPFCVLKKEDPDAWNKINKAII